MALQIYIFPDYRTILEIVLIGLIVALVGAGGLVYFIFSMKDDRADNRRRKLVEQNPWSKLEGEDSVEAPKNRKLGRIKRGPLLFIPILVVLIVLLIALKYGWI